MKKINKLLYLFFVSVFIFSACNNLSENSLKEEIPEGYGLVSGQIDCNSHYRSAFNVVLPDQNIFYKVIAEDSEGVLETVTATAVKKNATFVLQNTIKKNTAKYQLMLPYGTWNITIEGYTAYSYDAETEEDAPAVTIYLKRDTQVERERKADAGTTNIFTNKHYGVALTNSTKVVLAKFKKA